jgi:hypothetical protein
MLKFSCFQNLLFQIGQRAIQVKADLRDVESSMVGTVRPLNLRGPIARAGDHGLGQGPAD